MARPCALPPAPRVFPKASSTPIDRKSTRLNSSHGYISYAVFCLKKKTRFAVVPFRRLRRDVQQPIERRLGLRQLSVVQERKPVLIERRQVVALEMHRLLVVAQE